MTAPHDDDPLSLEIRDALAPTSSEVDRLRQLAFARPTGRTAVKLSLAAAAVLAALVLWPRGTRVHLVVEEVDGFLVVHGREGSRSFVSKTGKRPQIHPPIELLNDEGRRR